MPAALPAGAAPAPPVLAARAWVRKPSSSQLDRYRPVGSPAGWGVVYGTFYAALAGVQAQDSRRHMQPGGRFDYFAVGARQVS